MLNPQSAIPTTERDADGLPHHRIIREVMVGILLYLGAPLLVSSLVVQTHQPRFASSLAYGRLDAQTQRDLEATFTEPTATSLCNRLKKLFKEVGTDGIRWLKYNENQGIAFLAAWEELRRRTPEKPSRSN